MESSRSLGGTEPVSPLWQSISERSNRFSLQEGIASIFIAPPEVDDVEEGIATRARGAPKTMGATRSLSRTHHKLHHSKQRQCVARIVENMVTDGVVGGVILFNFMLVCLDTDAQARKAMDETAEPPSWVLWSMFGCFLFFFLEMCLKIYVDQSSYLHNPWNRFDLFLISFGAFEQFAKLQHLHFEGMGAVRLLDLSRLLRLLKVLRLISIFKELRRLMYMFAGSFRTLMWSFTLLVGVMTIWACIAVELIHPLVLDILAETPAWNGYDRAARAFSSVFEANVTLWQTIVAHDNWGLMAIPVIEHRPWTAFVFAGALLSLVFGVLNVVVVVMVDSCAEARARDFMNNALDIEEEEKIQKQVLSRMFSSIDGDASGQVSWEELKDGATNVEEFKHWLRVLDVDEEDLQQLFDIVDSDRSGFIDQAEFIEAMYRLKNAESKTATKMIKYLVTKIAQRQQAMENKQTETQTELGVVRADLKKVTREHLHQLQQVLDQNQGAIEEKLRAVVTDLQSALSPQNTQRSEYLSVEHSVSTRTRQEAPADIGIGDYASYRGDNEDDGATFRIEATLNRPRPPRRPGSPGKIADGRLDAPGCQDFLGTDWSAPTHHTMPVRPAVASVWHGCCSSGVSQPPVAVLRTGHKKAG